MEISLCGHTSEWQAGRARAHEASTVPRNLVAILMRPNERSWGDGDCGLERATTHAGDPI